MTAIFELARVNPWWLDASKINDEKEIKAFDESLVKWQPHLSKYISLKQSGFFLYTIRGPRQVGKTTFTKTRIRNLLVQEKVPPAQVFYWTCESIRNLRDLENTIRTYIDFSRSHDVEGIKRHLNIFIDEVTFVPKWQRAIKSLYESKMLEETTVIVTGSHALGVREGLGDLTGRTGEAGEPAHKMFVPMKFAEYISCVSQEAWSILSREGFHQGHIRRQLLKDFLLGNNQNWQFPMNIMMIKEKLDVILNSYMVTGGVPIAIHQYLQENKIQCSTFQRYINATHADISKWKLNISLVQELLAEACRSLASEVSWTGIATRVGSNHHTIRNYADTLVLCFAITYLKKFNPKSRRDKPNQNKKVYFEDPFLFHAIRHWVLSAPVGDEWSTCQDYLADSSSRGKLVENIVQNHLIRFAFDQNPTSLFDPRNELFHYNEKGRVIDFILDLEGKLFPFEVRYQSSISSSDSANIVSFARQEGTKAVLITRDQMTIKEHLLEIPASLFLTLI